MRLLLRLAVGTALVLGSTTPQVLHAQKHWTIIYRHSAAGSADLQYRRPGDRTDRPRGGLGSGDMLTVPQGSTVCFVVDQANPLLYTYQAASKTVAVTAPDNLDAIVKALAPVISSTTGPSNASVLSASAAVKATLSSSTADSATRATANAQLAKLTAELVQLDLYARTLDTLKTSVSELTKLKASSDDYKQFSDVMTKADALRSTFDAALKAANESQKAARKSVAEDNVILGQLAALQDVLVQNGAANYAEFVDANKRLADELCTTVKESRTQFVLGTKSRRGDGTKPARLVKDTVATVILEPRSDAAFEVAAGFMLGPSLSRSSFALKDGVVVDNPTEDPLVRPGVFAMGRLWDAGWLWASIGATKGKEATPDLFFGLVARPGLSLAITQLTLGAGLGLFQVPVGLTKGAVGTALPKDVTDLDKIIDRRYRAGLALTFNLTGLSTGK